MSPVHREALIRPARTAFVCRQDFGPHGSVLVALATGSDSIGALPYENSESGQSNLVGTRNRVDGRVREKYPFICSLLWVNHCSSGLASNAGLESHGPRG